MRGFLIDEKQWESWKKILGIFEDSAEELTCQFLWLWLEVKKCALKN